jgi:hypothetical protein
MRFEICKKLKLLNEFKKKLGLLKRIQGNRNKNEMYRSERTDGQEDQPFLKFFALVDD